MLEQSRIELCSPMLLNNGVYNALWNLYDITINGETYKTRFGSMQPQAFKVNVIDAEIYRE